MQFVPVVCSQCGAPLTVPEGVNFVTCGHCHVALAVKREAHVIYTERLEQLDRKTDHLAEEVALLRYRAAIDDIDKQWERQRQRFQWRDKYGNLHEPSEFAVGAMSLVVAGLEVTLLVAGFSQAEWLLGAAAILLFGGGYCLFSYYQLRAFRRAERHYRGRRQALTIAQFMPPAE